MVHITLTSHPTPPPPSPKWNWLKKINHFLLHTVTTLEIEDHSHVYSPEERTLSTPSPPPPLSQSRHHHHHPQQRGGGGGGDSNYTPVYNYNGYQLPPRMAQQHQHQQQSQASSNGGGGGGDRHGGTGAQHSGRQSTQQHKQE